MVENLLIDFETGLEIIEHTDSDVVFNALLDHIGPIPEEPADGVPEKIIHCPVMLIEYHPALQAEVEIIGPEPVGEHLLKRIESRRRLGA